MKNSEIILPSNTRFGTFFSMIFFTLFLYFFINSNILLASIFFLLSCVIGLITIIKPIVLLPFNKLWMAVGFFLGKIITPLVLGTLFYFLITPIGIATRLAGRDELRLNTREQRSFWRFREHKKITPNSFKNQY